MIPEILKNQELNYLEFSKSSVEKLEAERAIIHYISTNDIDRVRDIMYPDGMDAGEFNRTAKSVWYNHNYKYDPNALPIGRNQWLKKKPDGILAKTEFTGLDFADDVYYLHKNDFVNTWSIGFTPVYDKNGEIKKDTIENINGVTHWKQWKLFEYSSAPIPANVYAGDVAKSLIKDLKSKEFKSLVEEEYNKNLINSQIKELKTEIEKIKELLKELNVDDIFSVVEDNEKSIAEIKSQIIKLIKRIEPIEALGNSERFKQISFQIVRDAVQKNLK